MKYYSFSEEDTFQFAKKLTDRIKAGQIFLVNGDLGVGKSVFIRGLITGLGVNEPILSPTFTIVNEYIGKFKIYHFDFYRIEDPFELYEIGIEDYLYSDGICMIEWPDKGGDIIPKEAIKISIKIKDNKREITIQWNQ